jgi:hypothetical protein
MDTNDPTEIGDGGPASAVRTVVLVAALLGLSLLARLGCTGLGT